jgi:hypothetical protein
MRNKYLAIIIFLSISLIASLSLVLKTTVFVNKATSDNESTIALENSYLFASPLQVKADNKEKMLITVLLLDGRGLGVPNQVVNISTSDKINIVEVQKSTDQSGKAIFDLSSNNPGQFNLSAKTNGKTIPQQVKVVFY